MKYTDLTIEANAIERIEPNAGYYGNQLKVTLEDVTADDLLQIVRDCRAKLEGLYDRNKAAELIATQVLREQHTFGDLMALMRTLLTEEELES